MCKYEMKMRGHYPTQIYERALTPLFAVVSADNIDALYDTRNEVNNRTTNHNSNNTEENALHDGTKEPHYPHPRHHVIRDPLVGVQ